MRSAASELRAVCACAGDVNAKSAPDAANMPAVTPAMDDLRNLRRDDEQPHAGACAAIEELISWVDVIGDASPSGNGGEGPVAALAADQRLIDPDEREGLEQPGLGDVSRVERIEPEIAKRAHIGRSPGTTTRATRKGMPGRL